MPEDLKEHIALSDHLRQTGSYKDSSLFMGLIYDGDPNAIFGIGHQALGIYSYKDGSFKLRQMIGLRARINTAQFEQAGLFENVNSIIFEGVQGIILNEAYGGDPIIDIDNSLAFDEKTFPLFCEFLESYSKVHSHDPLLQIISEYKAQPQDFRKSLKKIRAFFKENISLKYETLKELLASFKDYLLLEYKSESEAVYLSSLILSARNNIKSNSEGLYVQLAPTTLKEVAKIKKTIEQSQDTAVWALKGPNCHTFAALNFKEATGVDYTSLLNAPVRKGVLQRDIDDQSKHIVDFHLSAGTLATMTSKEKEYYANNVIAGTFAHFINKINSINEVQKNNNEQVDKKLEHDLTENEDYKKSVELLKEQEVFRPAKPSFKRVLTEDDDEYYYQSSSEINYPLLSLDDLRVIDKHYKNSVKEESESSDHNQLHVYNKLEILLTYFEKSLKTTLEKNSSKKFSLGIFKEDPKKLVFSQTLKKIEKDKNLIAELKKSSSKKPP